MNAEIVPIRPSDFIKLREERDLLEREILRLTERLRQLNKTIWREYENELNMSLRAIERMRRT